MLTPTTDPGRTVKVTREQRNCEGDSSASLLKFRLESLKSLVEETPEHFFRSLKARDLGLLRKKHLERGKNYTICFALVVGFQVNVVFSSGKVSDKE